MSSKTYSIQYRNIGGNFVSNNNSKFRNRTLFHVQFDIIKLDVQRKTKKMKRKYFKKLAPCTNASFNETRSQMWVVSNASETMFEKYVSGSFAERNEVQIIFPEFLPVFSIVSMN